jgi:hypothetical protein
MTNEPKGTQEALDTLYPFFFKGDESPSPQQLVLKMADFVTGVKLLTTGNSRADINASQVYRKLDELKEAKASLENHLRHTVEFMEAYQRRYKGN